MPILPSNLAVAYGKISSYLAQVDVTSQNAFNNGALSSKLPTQILMATKTIEWIYTINPNDPALSQTTNYLVALCGKYILQAQGIGGGSGGIINPYTRVSSTILAFDLQFTIGAGTTPIDPNTTLPIVAGGTQFIVPYTSILVKSIGVVYNGTPLPQNVSSVISFTVAYTINNAIVTMNQPLNDTDTLIVTGLQYTNT